MSIILKGIDLPDKKLMEIFESDNHICIGGNYYPLMIKDVIQIPNGHGRIIDESKIYCVDHDEYETPSVFETDAPTILEAEE